MPLASARSYDTTNIRMSDLVRRLAMPLALLPDSAQLTQEAIRDYRELGFTVVRGMFTDSEIKEALQEADRLFGRRDLIANENIRCRWQPHVETQECLFE